MLVTTTLSSGRKRGNKNLELLSLSISRWSTGTIPRLLLHAYSWEEEEGLEAVKFRTAVEREQWTLWWHFFQIAFSQPHRRSLASALEFSCVVKQPYCCVALAFIMMHRWTYAVGAAQEAVGVRAVAAAAAVRRRWTRVLWSSKTLHSSS